MKKYILTSTFILSSSFFANSLLANSARDLNFEASCEVQNKATISFVGDILIHKAIYESVAKGSKDFSSIWKSTNPMIQKADFRVGNLEGPAALGIDASGKDRGDIGFVYDGSVYSGTKFIFNFHPRIASDLKKSGYDLISFANNHTLDRHSIGVDRTLENLRAEGLLTAGAKTTYEENDKFFSIANIEGINVAFLACTEMLNGRKDTKNQVLNCYNGDTEKMIAELSKSPDVDFVVVMPHWGEENKLTPNSKQKSFARKYAEAGALAIIGSHPHVPQPWEKYITSKGEESLIVYSLGNFVAWQKGINNKTGPIVYLNITQEANEKAKIAGVAYSLTQRQGNSVLPVGKRNTDFIKNAEQFFGSKGLILPEEPLSKVLCK